MLTLNDPLDPLHIVNNNLPLLETSSKKNGYVVEKGQTILETKDLVPLAIPKPNSSGLFSNPFLGSLKNSKIPVPKPSTKLIGFPIISILKMTLYI